MQCLRSNINDESGKNLVGTAGYDKESIKITYSNPVPPKSGAVIPDGATAQHYDIVDDLDGEKFIKVFLNIGNEDSTTADTTIQWNESESDTFRSEIIRGEGHIIVEKVYQNGELVLSDRKKDLTLIK